MCCERWLTPTCEEHVEFLRRFGWLYPMVDEWCHGIAAGGLDVSRPPTEVSLWSVVENLAPELGGLDKLANVSGDWALSHEAWMNASAADRLRLLVTVVRKKFVPPVMARVQRRRFVNHEDPILRAEVTAVYVVDTAKRVVNFHALWYASPEPVSDVPGGGSRRWG
jgi:hypothetical protein